MNHPTVKLQFPLTFEEYTKRAMQKLRNQQSTKEEEIVFLPIKEVGFHKELKLKEEKEKSTEGTNTSRFVHTKSFFLEVERDIHKVDDNVPIDFKGKWK